ncbi:MAG: hypothetical protein IH920_03645, partial [Chloroflexi bacterium]|nr:hypothetical protein [Chloroflexota bacterium]
VLLVLGVIPVVGIFIWIAVFFWTLVTTVIAIRQALDFDTGRAIATAVVSWLVFFVISLVITAILV